MDDTVDIKSFIEKAFPRELMCGDETPVISHPDFFYDEDGERVDYFRKLAWSPRHFRGRPKAWYVCISSAVARDRVRTRMQDIRNVYMIVFDDIGTKAAEPPVEPSYKLETSRGNYQWGYFLELPYAVTDTAGQRYVDAILEAAAKAGFNDPGCRNPTRLVRVPGSLHSSGFIARIVDWNPHRLWTLEGLVKALGLDVRKRRLKNRIAETTDLSLAEVVDPVYEWLQESGGALGHNDAWVFVQCPWEAQHTKASGLSATAYSPEGYGMMGRQFRCFHGHCAGRSLGDFLTEVRRAGGPSVDPNAGMRLRDYSNVLKTLGV